MFELCMEITLQLCFIFARHCDVFLLSCNYVIYLFDVVTFFDNVRITLYFGAFELRMEITSQLRIVFARHCDVFFITYFFGFFYYVRITLYVSTFELRIEITL